jgi:hypothetical protein
MQGINKAYKHRMCHPLTLLRKSPRLIKKLDALERFVGLPYPFPDVAISNLWMNSPFTAASAHVYMALETLAEGQVVRNHETVVAGVQHGITSRVFVAYLRLSKFLNTWSACSPTT